MTKGFPPGIYREVHSQTNGWFAVRLRPYRTVEDKIDGVVITFLDVADRHKMEEELRECSSSENDYNWVVLPLVRRARCEIGGRRDEGENLHRKRDGQSGQTGQ